MKKIFTIFTVVTTVITVVSAYSPYSGEEISGDKKFCYYADGSIITVKYYDQCPMSN